MSSLDNGRTVPRAVWALVIFGLCLVILAMSMWMYLHSPYVITLVPRAGTTEDRAKVLTEMVRPVPMGPAVVLEPPATAAPAPQASPPVQAAPAPRVKRPKVRRAPAQSPVRSQLQKQWGR